jgi:hypothetical protein
MGRGVAEQIMYFGWWWTTPAGKAIAHEPKDDLAG